MSDKPEGWDKWQAIREGKTQLCDGCKQSLRNGDDYVLRSTDGKLYCITCATRAEGTNERG